jgi:tripartite-type tricarboxylate transporter receptor subunit TctC
MITPLRTAAAAIAAIIALAAPDTLHAQNYPTRSVTLIVPSAAGGGPSRA